MTYFKSRLATLAMMTRALARQPGLVIRRPRYLFVLSHMRSNTSLLSHLLGSHPEIRGHSEMHLRYRHGFDLLKLRCKVFLDNDDRLDGRYVLDKILHDNLVIRPAILDRADLRLVFIVREPAQTLRSILHMGSLEESPNWKQDPRRVAAYYCQRLAGMEACYHVLGPGARQRRAFFLCAEDLIAQPEAMLARLSAWLGLAEPLTPEYRVFQSTGQPGLGDPLGNIKAGRIVPQADRYRHIDLDPTLLAQAARAHDRFLALWQDGNGPHRQPAAGRTPALIAPGLAGGRP